MAAPKPEPTELDHLAQARARLPSQWAGAARIDLALELLFGGEFGGIKFGAQYVELFFRELLTERRLDTAVGAQLDGLGELIGLSRHGDTDALYRIELHVAGLANRSHGTAHELSEVAKAAAGAQVITAAVVLDAPPAAFVMHLTASVALTTDQVATLIEFIPKAKAAGVGINMLSWSTGDVFSWDEDPDPFAAGFDVGDWATILLP